MAEQKKTYFTIYARGGEWTVAVRGQERFLREQAFLDQFWGRIKVYSNNEEVPDPHYYILEDDQMNAYWDFRRQMDAEFGRDED